VVITAHTAWQYEKSRPEVRKIVRTIAMAPWAVAAADLSEGIKTGADFNQR
jgi:uncharacterized protein (DUF427 family)